MHVVVWQSLHLLPVYYGIDNPRDLLTGSEFRLVGSGLWLAYSEFYWMLLCLNISTLAFLHSTVKLVLRFGSSSRACMTPSQWFMMSE